MQCDRGHNVAAREHSSDESASAAISTASERRNTWVAARWREKKRQKVYKGGC